MDYAFRMLIKAGHGKTEEPVLTVEVLRMPGWDICEILADWEPEVAAHAKELVYCFGLIERPYPNVARQGIEKLVALCVANWPNVTIMRFGEMPSIE